jgi:putative membrane protein
MKTILRFMLNLVAVLGAVWFVGGVSVSNAWALIAFALVLGVINWAVKPILTLLTLPITVLTLGIWYLVLNGLLVWLASAFVPGFAIQGLWSAIWFAIVLSVLNWLLSLIFRTDKE